MKFFVKGLFWASVIGCLTLAFHGDAFAADSIAEKCDYVQEDGVNPDFSTVNCLLTEAALEFDVPPEIVKAVAEGESGNWQHYDENGDVIITDDNGIGLMQITNQSGYEEDLLKNDIIYNIRAGVETLDYMFDRTDLPTIGNGERDVLEHWYFALMAYNGTKPVNSPVVQATGERNTDAYQEKIIRIIEDFGLVSFAELPFTRDDFDYDPSSNENIEFVTMEYSFGEPFTKTKHGFKAGQEVKATQAVSFRERPTTDSGKLGTLAEDEVVTIQAPFTYEEAVENKNHFVWYQIKRSDGTVGYVASSYLTYKFKDIDVGLYAEDQIYYLYEKGLLYGIGKDRFGFKDNLTRWQAVLLLNRANNVSIGDRPDPGFTDVPRAYKYYDQIAAAVDEGLFNGKSETHFEPEATLKRSEMAAVLQRIYEFPAASSHPFTDVNSGAWYEDAIARLYNAGIAAGVSPTKFGPYEEITREQFAVFMARSMNEDFRVR
ncbi:S-layer homology domain-containing protein [Pseudalkalibacillus sp. A8]|uniref:S-layer homology domain-containing protein n=1 Tax=Pseudalkalibacillus sp. A8 TaxID=3382641 RepID=UPI0038B66963